MQAGPAYVWSVECRRLALFKLVRDGVLVRDANGVYHLPRLDNAPPPSIREIAEAKIAAFARRRQGLAGEQLEPRKRPDDCAGKSNNEAVEPAYL